MQKLTQEYNTVEPCILKPKLGYYQEGLFIFYSILKTLKNSQFPNLYMAQEIFFYIKLPEPS